MNPKLKSRLYLLLIFIACVAPVALSYFAYYVWKPEKRMNHGELLQSRPLPAYPYQGKWLLLLIDPASCATDCERRLYAMRQTALAMEIKQDKLAQAWLVEPAGTPKSELLAQYPRTNLLAANADWVLRLPQPAAGRVFLIDPNGLPVLRYPADPDVKRMMKDLGRLLDVKRM